MSEVTNIEEKSISSITLKWQERSGGRGRTATKFLDFVIDGASLREKIGGDLASCLGWLVPTANEKAVNRILLNEPADFPDNRRSLYVCPECGDLGCGAVSALVERVQDKVIWRDFGYQNNYESGVSFEGFEALGPIIFDATEYESAIRQALDITYEQ